MSIAVSNPVLIVSTGRTGTRFIASLLSECFPGVEAHHITPRSTLINVISNIHLARLLPESALLQAWRLLKGRDYARTEQRVFVDSNNHLYAFAAYGHQIYTGLKVVHVVRDPRTYVRSHLNWTHERPKSYVANHILPFWQPNGFLVGKLTLGQWLRLDGFERFCWIWDFKNRFLTQIAHSDRPYLLMRFEDLVADSNQQALDQLGDFIGARPPKIPPLAVTLSLPRNATRSRPLQAWQQWSPARCRQLHRLCGEQMSDFGYGQEVEWRELLSRAH